MLNNQKAFHFKDTVFRRFVLRVLRLLLYFFADIEVQNSEKVRMSGAVMLAANHVSEYDAVVMQVVIARPLCFMGKAELFRNPIPAWVFNQLGLFPVKRGEFDRQSLLNARYVVQAGLALMIFPEGTRTFGNGMVEARSGTAHLAMRNHCDIMPIAISGAENILKKGFKRAQVKIVFGESITPGENETAQELTIRMMRAIALLLPEDYRGVYA